MPSALDRVDEGVEGAIIGTALYEGRFTLTDALDLTWPDRR
jgi:phosphoribosylanthranilate isomerase